jgi:site-specific DNA-methyltransferase (adenine-specific)
LKDKPNRWAGHSNLGDPSKREKDGNLKKVDKFVVSEFGTRYNVWYVNNGKGFSSKDDIAFQHPAIFPDEMARRHIVSWTNEGDVVYDPFLGSATTTRVARELNRQWIGSELHTPYFEVCKEIMK